MISTKPFLEWGCIWVLRILGERKGGDRPELVYKNVLNLSCQSGNYRSLFGSLDSRDRVVEGILY